MSDKLTAIVAAIDHLKRALADNNFTLVAIEIAEDIHGMNMTIKSDGVHFIHDPLYAKYGTQINGVKIKGGKRERD